jgi:hypothetical protein
MPLGKLTLRQIHANAVWCIQPRIQNHIACAPNQTRGICANTKIRYIRKLQSASSVHRLSVMVGRDMLLGRAIGCTCR